MNTAQTKFAIQKFINQEAFVDTAYWDPYNFGKCAEMRLPCTSKYSEPIIFLCQECEPLKSRITGTIQDDWFVKENFTEIAAMCYEILKQISLVDKEFEPWQTQLMNKFEEFSK
jgi:hypothetical protein